MFFLNTPPLDKNVDSLDKLDIEIDNVLCSFNSKLSTISINNLTRIIAAKLHIDVELESIVYFDNQDTQWETPYFYTWNNTLGEEQAKWPGEPMEFIKDNIWKAKVTVIGATNIIFNKGVVGSKADQTKDFILRNDHVYNFTLDCGLIPEDFFNS